MPLIHGDELVGGLVLGFRASSAFGATDQAFARLLAQSAGSALARACTLERERDGRLEAETMARARKEVLGIVAHDLRNPLGVVSSSAYMDPSRRVSTKRARACVDTAGAKKLKCVCAPVYSP